MAVRDPEGDTNVPGLRGGGAGLADGYQPWWSSSWPLRPRGNCPLGHLPGDCPLPASGGLPRADDTPGRLPIQSLQPLGPHEVIASKCRHQTPPALCPLPALSDLAVPAPARPAPPSPPSSWAHAVSKHRLHASIPRCSSPPSLQSTVCGRASALHAPLRCRGPQHTSAPQYRGPHL